MGYLVVVERAPASTRPISSHTSHFQVREDFHDTSYLERYSLLCQKLVFERHYTAAALLWTESDGCFGDVAESVNLETFLRSYMGHLLGHLHLFQI
jgi:type II restriction enzyme